MHPSAFFNVSSIAAAAHAAAPAPTPLSHADTTAFMNVLGYYPPHNMDMMGMPAGLPGPVYTAMQDAIAAAVRTSALQESKSPPSQTLGNLSRLAEVFSTAWQWRNPGAPGPVAEQQAPLSLDAIRGTYVGMLLDHMRRVSSTGNMPQLQGAERAKNAFIYVTCREMLWIKPCCDDSAIATVAAGLSTVVEVASSAFGMNAADDIVNPLLRQSFLPRNAGRSHDNGRVRAQLDRLRGRHRHATTSGDVRGQIDARAGAMRQGWQVRLRRKRTKTATTTRIEDERLRHQGATTSGNVREQVDARTKAMRLG